MSRKRSKTKRTKSRILDDNSYNLKIAREYKKSMRKCVGSKKYGGYDLFDPMSEWHMTSDEANKIRKCAEKYKHLRDKIKYKNWFFKSTEFEKLLREV